jgi:dolichol-phosphate mannosyltransferase
VPLKIVTYFGLLVASLAIAAGLIIVVLAVSTEITVPGWASIMVGLFVMGGLQIFITGVVGVYVGKTFEETKKRPLYFVRDTSNLPAA